MFCGKVLSTFDAEKGELLLVEEDDTTLTLLVFYGIHCRHIQSHTRTHLCTNVLSWQFLD